MAASNRGQCERCGKPALLRQYCTECRKTITEFKRQYVQSAAQILATTGPLSTAWGDLERWRESVGLPSSDARSGAAHLASDWLRRYAAFAASDGVVSDSEWTTFNQAARALAAQPTLVQQLGSWLQRVHALGVVHTGQLPVVEVLDLHLPSDEHCHLCVPATRWRPLKSGPQPAPGLLVVTNRKIRFSALQHGGEVALGKVLRVTWLNQHMISLEATTRTLSGHYSTDDPEWAAAVIDTALRIDRRVILPGASSNGSRAIPHHVKTAVWQRDRGRCIQCNADAYLEFDHIIPWSKGGASTVGNIQLLCRRCNLTKSDRI
ncbi:hypothetical protein ABIA39_000308 [Nocardia sp. GAS34]|uniref:HNH endonuclease n=1 Tax=unclassified Nocardia TaxID=2637762 RepID=UPI003D2327BA